MNLSKLHSVVLLGVGIGIGSTTSMLLRIDPAQAIPQTVPSFNPSLSLAPLVETLSDAVVNINVEVVTTHSGSLAPFGWNIDPPLQSGQGSGFLISEDGYILTNHHVIQGADTLTVKLNNDDEYTGSVIGFDDSIDVALIKIDGKKSFPYVQLGDSDLVRVGDYAVAIGNPFGLSHTVTMGIISAKERSLGSGPYDDYLQTDASINPGNSGGPLFNLDGQVVGINTAINPRAQGIGFSVPINTVTQILDDLKTNGRPSRGWLGLSLQPMLEDNTTNPDTTRGPKVQEVYPNTPAMDAGLKKGDRILEFDGNVVQNVDTFIRMVGSYRTNDTISMRILRAQKTIDLEITLGERPSQRELGTRGFSTSAVYDWGIQTTLSNSFSENITDQGLVVIDVESNSPLKDSVQLGDVILRVNDSPIEKDIFNRFNPNTDVVVLKVWRQGQMTTIRYTPS